MKKTLLSKIKQAIAPRKHRQLLQKKQYSSLHTNETVNRSNVHTSTSTSTTVITLSYQSHNHEHNSYA